MSNFRERPSVPVRELESSNVLTLYSIWIKEIFSGSESVRQHRYVLSDSVMGNIRDKVDSISDLQMKDLSDVVFLRPQT